MGGELNVFCGFSLFPVSPCPCFSSAQLPSLRPLSHLSTGSACILMWFLLDCLYTVWLGSGQLCSCSAFSSGGSCGLPKPGASAEIKWVALFICLSPELTDLLVHIWLRPGQFESFARFSSFNDEIVCWVWMCSCICLCIKHSWRPKVNLRCLSSEAVHHFFWDHVSLA